MGFFTGKNLMWPDWLSSLYSEYIVDEIDRDDRSVGGTYLGWPKDRIFTDVLEGGRADFAASHGTLSSDDRALLYARYNQPRHLDELIEAFTTMQSGDKSRLDRCTILDLGCGPFTGGLAFAAALGADCSFRYYGVDRALSMLTLGKKLYCAAQQSNAFHEETRCEFLAGLEQIQHERKHGRLTIVIASYLLASESFKAVDTVAQLARTLTDIGPGAVVVLYTNSVLPVRNMKFPEFSDALIKTGFRHRAGGEGIVYGGVKNPAPLRYELFYRPEIAEISLESKS
ncbi:hypothetical protein ACFFTM_02195 [Pseudoduganella plicata]|uniref:Methyltransferase domain-containing protein n=1 Tax=Pseudoduganella plicata TaxID=321984 RepID=A0A4P7BGV3_9BURK|nr:hypothetical protein [Pseudoduganella plicata]QBQ36815.1 hypothetical protein E1742_12035 [Pseudoduganella plicata]GGY72493.1 hypothetical protein GCM10007388_00630 [Pseudoduganella plicata]